MPERAPDPASWALVVGIDEYDDPAVPRLKGAAADAVEVVGWLRRLGLPDEQILLHAAPSQATAPSIAALAPGVPAQDAREETIWGSVDRLMKVLDGDRLFVFLSGHGVWEPTGGRLFLTQDAGKLGVIRNLAIDKYIDCFLSTAFRRQFLVMDGCLNLPYTLDERPKIPARIFSGLPYTPKDTNWLVACFGAALGQLAYEIDGRGAFLRRLLPAMDPDHPMAEGITLDFATGVRSVDIQAVMTRGVASRVEQDARAQVPAKQQTPQVQVRGNVTAGGATPVFEVVPAEVVGVTLAVEPVAAAADVELLHLWVDDRPWWSIDQPTFAGDAIEWPVRVSIPSNLPARATCRVRPNAPWDVESTELAFRAATGQAQVFRMRPRAADGGASVDLGGVTLGGEPAAHRPTRGLGGDPPEAAGPTEQYSVKVIDSGGFLTGAMVEAYPKVEEAIGTAIPWPDPGAIQHGPTSPWVQVEPGIELQRHETGPEFRVDVSHLARGRIVADRWASAIRGVLPDLAVVTVLRGNEPPPAAPNLEIVFSAGGAARIGGALAGRPTVSIGRPAVPSEPVWRSGRGVSLASLETAPLRRIDPGPVEVRIDLPWGSWSTVAGIAERRDPVRVELPAEIGTPPLRNRLGGLSGSGGGRLYGLSGPAPRARIRRADLPGRTALRAHRTTGTSWSFHLPDIESSAGDAEGVLAPGVVSLESELGSASFPVLRSWSMGVDWSVRGLRVEPLSGLDSAEWDLLVGTGRLDLMTDADVVQLTFQKWYDVIQGVAGGYGLYAANNWKDLVVVAGNLWNVGGPSIPDVDLLRIAAATGARKRVPAASRHRLREVAAREPVPVFRWGVTLARDLIRRSGDPAPSWDRRLAMIEASLSPLSAWTAWTGVDQGD